MTTAIVLLVSAAAAYFLGCLNGAILISRAIFHEDIRQKGSGNAGLTNFYRIYGVKGVLAVIAIDMLKAAASVLIGRFLFDAFLQQPVLGSYWGGLWVILGHSYPCTFRFKGGKGILCAGMMLILLDWRIAVVGFGAFFAGATLSGYISLGSILAIISFPFTTWWAFHGEEMFPWILAIGLAAAASTFWSHRSNVIRLLKGKENKFHFHGVKEKTE